MATTIQPIQIGQCLVGWNVSFEVQGDFTVLTIVRVDIDELPIPAYPTDHQIAAVARAKARQQSPKPLRARRVRRERWTRTHDACQTVAVRDSLDVDLLVETLPDSLQTLQAEFESRELAKREAHRLTGLSVRDVERIDDSGRDYASIPNIDTNARSLAYEFHELNWDPDDANSAKLWDLLHEPTVRKPGRLSVETIERAAELLTIREREIEFSEWDEESLDDQPAELPF